jgi:RNA polymerase-binding transcription factor DksA
MRIIVVVTITVLTKKAMQETTSQSRSRSWEPLREMLLHRQAELVVSLSLSTKGCISSASAPRVTRVLKGKLDRIQSALARIDAGTFGACLLCGNTIAEERLRDLPWERFCAHCKESPGAHSSGAPSGSNLLFHPFPKPA